MICHKESVTDELDTRFDDVVSVKFQRILEAVRCPDYLMNPVLLDIIIQAYYRAIIEDFAEYNIMMINRVYHHRFL